MKNKCLELLETDLTELYLKRNNNVPEHVDEHEYYRHSGALGSFTLAVMIAAAEQKLLPYPVIIGERPVIYLCYKPE